VICVRDPWCGAVRWILSAGTYNVLMLGQHKYASVPCGVQLAQTAGSSYTNPLIPNGASGTLLYSNFLLTSLLADFAGSRCENHSRLRVSGRNLSQSWSGQTLSTVARAEIKCSLKVSIACSAALTR